MTLFEKIEAQFKGYTVKKLNLNEFIMHNCLDMILNNDIRAKGEFEIYNMEKLTKYELENVKEELEEELEDSKKGDIGYLLRDALEFIGVDEEDVIEYGEIENFKEFLEEKAQERVYEEDIYQYFIIPNNQVDLWDKYADYPIFYSYDWDMYLLGITHWGMSWDYSSTEYIVREYI